MHGTHQLVAYQEDLTAISRTKTHYLGAAINFSNSQNTLPVLPWDLQIQEKYLDKGDNLQETSWLFQPLVLFLYELNKSVQRYEILTLEFNFQIFRDNLQLWSLSCQVQLLGYAVGSCFYSSLSMQMLPTMQVFLVMSFCKQNTEILLLYTFLKKNLIV